MTPEENHRPESFAWLAKRSNVVWLALIFFLILSAASFFLIYGHYRDAREQVFREDRKSAKLISLIVEAYLNEIRSTLESYASRPLLLEAVRRRDVLAAKQHLASLNRVSPGMDSLLIADKLGTVWISLPDRPDVLGKNFAWRDWHRGVIREKKPYVGDAVLRVTGEKDAAIHIAVPIFDKKKEIIGIRKYQPSAFGSGKSAITGITGSSALFGKENLHIRPVTARKMSKVHNIRGTVIICHDNLHIVPGRNGIETPLQQARYVLMGNND